MTTRTYNAGLSTAVDRNKLIPAVPLSAMEIIVYLPKQVAWPAILVRLLRAGFTGPQIAKAQLHARRTLSRDELRRRRDALRHAILVAGKAAFNDPHFTQTGYANDPRMQPIDAANYPGRDCTPHYDGSEIDTRLSELDSSPPTQQQLTNGVHVHPTGNQAGVLTQVIDWATRAGELANFTVDDVATIAAQQGFVNPPASRRDDWDTSALDVVERIPNPTT